MALITAVLVLFAALFALAYLIKPKKSDLTGEAPGPKPWPWPIGNLPYIGKFKDIWDAFADLKAKYGNIASFRLGVHSSVVICGLKNFREVLVEKAQEFDARPSFKRYYLLFGGNKNNSLAFADGSDVHHKHRAAISFHTLNVKKGGNHFENLESATTEYIFRMMEKMKSSGEGSQTLDMKFELAEAIACIFLKYYTDKDVDTSDELFKSMLTSFDTVFQIINSGSVGDVLPFLMPFIPQAEYYELSHKIRQFTESCLFEPMIKARGSEMDENNNSSEKKEPNTLSSLLSLIDPEDPTTKQHVFYAFEDIVGGHSAVSNSLVRILIHIAKHPEVQQKIREEVKTHASGFPTMSDRLTYTEATIWEAFRFICSPIVPHVATQDTSIDGFSVKKDTVVFFNNMDINFSPDLWTSPQEFMPERFITGDRISKPEFFLPFSTGKRNCLGYRMAIHICRVIVANLCQNFEIQLDPSVDYDNMERGVIAVGRDKSFPLVYKPVVD